MPTVNASPAVLRSVSSNGASRRVPATIETVNIRDAVVPPPSRTATVNETVPGTAGVPDKMPVAESTKTPDSDPEVIAHVYGRRPPDARNLCWYGAPTTPKGSGEVLVIRNCGSSMVSVNSFDTVVPAASAI